MDGFGTGAIWYEHIELSPYVLEENTLNGNL
jgi:hypothetical protein